MEERSSIEQRPKRQLTKVQSITLMVVGGLMLLLSMVIRTEVPSTAHTIKVIVGMLGFIIGMVGVSLRPLKAPKKSEE